MTSLIGIFREVQDPRDFNARHDLADLLFAALAATLRGAKSCVEILYAALSKPIAPAKLAQVVRDHWTIENQLHWTLDMVFDEDDARTRKDYGPENLAVIRRLAHNILNAHPPKKPLISKMRRANRSKEFFFKLFTHMR
jgi:predicted transposase YbfD/YdcC